MTNINEKEFSKSDIHGEDIQNHLEHINREFSEGFDFIKRYPKSVTIFGSSMSNPDSEPYKKAEELGGRIAREVGYAVFTGGGPGVSLGLNISLPHERTTNAYVNHAIKFSYFFSRKTMLTFASEAYIFFPGGYGTFDELFNVLTLIQTGKIPRVPVIMFDSGYWNGMKQYLSDVTLNKYHAIGNNDLNLFEITDSLDRVIEIIKKAPVSEWWRNIN